MYSAKRLLLLALAGISLLVALFGLFRFLVEVGQSPLRYVVQDAAVFAAGLMGMFLCWRAGRNLMAGQERVRDAARQFSGSSFEAHASPVKQVLALAFVGVAGVASLLLYLQRPGDWVLGICALFFLGLTALLVPMALSQRRDGGPTLHMDARRLSHAWFGDVPWTKVHGIFHMQTKIKASTIHSLLLGVSEPDRFLGRMPWIARLMGRNEWSASRGRYGVLEIALNPLDKDPFLVVNAARALRGGASPPMVGGWHPGMDDESIVVGLELAYLADNPDRLPPEQILARMQAIEPRMTALTARLAGRRSS